MFTKQQLVDKVQEEMGGPEVEAENVVNAVTEAIVDALRGGDSVNIPPLGRFVLRVEGAHEGTDPRSHEAITIGPSVRVLFHPSGELRRAVEPSEEGGEQ